MNPLNLNCVINTTPNPCHWSSPVLNGAHSSHSGMPCSYQPADEKTINLLCQWTNYLHREQFDDLD